MDHSSLFDVQELVDHCIDCLWGSPSDLKVCALICRRCVYPAQSHLFRQFNAQIGGPPAAHEAWDRFRQVLKGSPHLIRHVCRLHIIMGPDERGLSLLWSVANFPFTHLWHVHIVHIGNLPMQHALALQQLLSVPTLRQLVLQGDSLGADSSEAFLAASVFGRCSPAMRYLRIQLLGAVPSVVYTNSRVAAAIPLTSLHIAIPPEPPQRFSPILWAFGASQLKALSVRGMVDWVLAAPVMNTIEILCLHLQPGSTTGLDLSAFINLSVLCINCARESEADLRALISTILPAHRIHTVVIWSWDRELCGVFDETLAPLHISMVEVEVNKANLRNVAEYFPRLREQGVVRLREQGVVRCFDFHRNWWKNMTANL
ncbi:hypothetical protein C8R47DRAFT_718742 [Mycena vitilis]|nr:hypothetical protein C8R47DRAFT_718742 [Mycena vitilis]